MKSMNLQKLLHKLAMLTFYRFTKNIESKQLRKKLSLIDYPHSEALFLATVFLVIFGTFIITLILSFILFFFVVRHPLVPLIPLIATVLVALLAILYPDLALSKKKKMIRANLPLAILTMSTITQAGAPPQYMFKTIAENPEYPKLSKECQKIERFMNQLGLSFTKAVDKAAEITPSVEFRTFLKELNTTVKSGGDLKEFMRKRAEDAYMKYISMIEEASDRAETMGEIYSIIMIAAPLFLFFTIMMLNFFSAGKIMGFTVDEIFSLSIFVGLPAANLIFLAVLYMMSVE